MLVLPDRKPKRRRELPKLSQYNKDKPKLKGQAFLLEFRDSFDFKKAKIQKETNFGHKINTQNNNFISQTTTI